MTLAAEQARLVLQRPGKPPGTVEPAPCDLLQRLADGVQPCLRVDRADLRADLANRLTAIVLGGTAAADGLAAAIKVAGWSRPSTA
jgi:hypothetical protein